MKLVVQFIHLYLGLLQSLPTDGGDLVNPPRAPTNIFQRRLQQTAAFQPMQQRVQSAWPNTIAVMPQFLHHPQPKDSLVRRVYQHVNPYKTEKEFPLLF